MMRKRHYSALVASLWWRSFPFESHFYDLNNNQYPSWAKTRPLPPTLRTPQHGPWASNICIAVLTARIFRRLDVPLP